MALVDKTYGMRMPTATHFREATCQEVECDAYANGWITMVDVSTGLGKQQANYIRLHAGRHYTVSELGTMISFTFPSGQKCFGTHRVRLEREAHFILQNRGRSQSLKIDDWMGDYNETVSDVADIEARG